MITQAIDVVVVDTVLYDTLCQALTAATPYNKSIEREDIRH